MPSSPGAESLTWVRTPFNSCIEKGELSPDGLSSNERHNGSATELYSETEGGARRSINWLANSSGILLDEESLKADLNRLIFRQTMG